MSPVLIGMLCALFIDGNADDLEVLPLKNLLSNNKTKNETPVF
ncbi:hypothetical protein [Psychromonas sp. Urea-02u-13]|nr:hypothetical protein [Psychromonas sp. Urea-02u-13]